MKPKTKLFQKKPSGELKMMRVPVRMTSEDKVKITRLAAVRNLTVSEFMRRAALGRRADVDYQTDTVLALSGFVRELRALRKATVEQGLQFPEESWLPVIGEVSAAIARITK